MNYKGKNKIRFLIAAGLLSVGLSGCKRDIKGYRDIQKIESIDKMLENEEQSAENHEEINAVSIEEFKIFLQDSFSKSEVTLDETSDKFVSTIDKTLQFKATWRGKGLFA